MPEYIRALIYILVMATLVFKFCAKPATAVAMTKEAFTLRRNTWYLITLAGFLSQNVWIFYFLSAFCIYRASKRDSNPVALFFFLLFAMPELFVSIPGFAGIEHFLDITYQRVLIWIIFLPVFWKMVAGKKKEKLVWNSVDIIFVTYVALNILLQLQYVNFTEWMRYSLYWIFDTVIPYFVISRSIKGAQDFKEVVMAFVVAAMVVSLVGFFEFMKQWLVYETLIDAIGVPGGMGYLARGDGLRANASAGHALVLGYLLAIAISLYFFLKQSIPDKKKYVLGLCLLIVGIISPLSKGPWVGAVVSVLLGVVLGPKAFSQLAKIVLPAVGAFVVILFTDYGEKVISYLPFVGTLDESSASYRKLILEKSIDVIFMNPFFGSNDYFLYLEDLRQGQGIIDIVNNYIGVALNTGFVGLTLYLMFFIVIFYRMAYKMFRLPLHSEERAIGQVLIGTLAGILVMISTMSDIRSVPILYWSIAAMGVAYSIMTLKSKINKPI